MADAEPALRTRRAPRRRRDRRRLGRPVRTQRRRRPAVRPRPTGGTQGRRDAGQRPPRLGRPHRRAAAARGHCDAGWPRPRRQPRACSSSRRALPRSRASNAPCWPRQARRRRPTWSSRAPTSGILPTRAPGGHEPPGAARRRATRSTRSTCCRWSRCAPAPRRHRTPCTERPPSTAASGCARCVLQHEVDGFVADRLLEALWREALWLVADGVATVEQIDDAIRFGAGLRWASMGTMLTYRIAGGEGGHAPLHGAVRSCPAVAVEQAHRRSGAHRRAARPHRGSSRTHRQAAPPYASSSGFATTASWACCRVFGGATTPPEPCSTSTSRHCVSAPAAHPHEQPPPLPVPQPGPRGIGRTPPADVSTCR